MDSELEAVIALLPPELADPATGFVDPVNLRARLAEYAALAEQAGLAPKPDPRVQRRDQLVPGIDGPDVPVRVYEPEGCLTGGPVILHVHGGAFVMGGIEQDNASCERMALATGRMVVSVEYRLAPEHPFPAGIDDCFAVYTWLTRGQSGLTVDPERIVVTGVSAGGALAAAVALRARDAGGVQPMYQLLLFPVLDDRMTTHSMQTLRSQPLWNARSNVVMWKHYLGDGHRANGDTSPYAAPARAKDLSGLPPTAIMAGEFDPLRDEAIEYAQRLMRAGVPTELHVVPGVIHAFDSAAPDTKLSKRVRLNRFAALNTVLARSPEQSRPQAGQRWLDPEVGGMVPFLPQGQSDDVVAGRKMLEEMLGVGAGPQLGEERLIIADRWIPGPAGAPDVSVRTYRPIESDGLTGCVVDYHGGAFIYGSVPMNHPANVTLAATLGVAVVSVEYRLAPENPFPAGVEDCYAALRWVHDHAADLNVDPERIAVQGGSAGGALAAAVALLARDRNGPRICLQSLMIPVTDDRMTTWSMRTFTDTPMFSRPGAESMWKHYLGAGYQERETSPYAAPARAADLSNLPRAYVQTADLDPLRDEGIAYAQRLMQSGVPVELHSYPGTFHGSGIATTATVTRRAQRELLDVLGAALGAAS